MAQATIQVEGAVMSIPLEPKVFSTGSTGYHGHGKLNAGGDKKFQINIMVVEIGSKPKQKK